LPFRDITPSMHAKTLMPKSKQAAQNKIMS